MNNFVKVNQVPLVSVLMTAYNREQFIAQSIESVLASTYNNFELIVVDDCSTDNTVEIAKSYAITDPRVKVYVNEKNLGDYPNRNKAASYASGKYLKYVDSDDIIYKHSLGVMIHGIELFPEAGYGLSSVSDPRTPYPVCISCKETYLENFHTYRHFDRAPGSAIIKKSSFDEVGGFLPQKYIGDMDLWLKLAQRFPLVKLPRDLVWDRIHQNAERVYEAKEKGIQKKREDLIISYLKAPNCPLSKSEIQKVLTKRKIKSLLILFDKIRHKKLSL